ncbi:hypothetical protein [Chryseobacterium terrae]|uniref:Uncharacterized protein n=1 Tax=Chryseobacterium terrae TaxID=3163299 RepID=A0ABW8Y0U5_9FLAO
MKTIYLILILILVFSCNSKKENSENVIIDPNHIRVGEIVHDTLSNEQIEKIKHIQSTFQEVYPIGLEETITNFKRDQNPDNEISIWLKMSDAYENYLQSQNDNLALIKKKEVFKIILSRSMMSSQEVLENFESKILTKDEAKQVLSYYKENAQPIRVFH